MKVDCKKILDEWWNTVEPFGFDHPDTYNGILKCMEKAVEPLKADNEKLKEEKKSIRAGIKHYHDGKISLSQLMDFY